MQKSANILAHFAHLALSLSLCLLLTACSSGGKSYESGAKTSSNLQEIADKIELARKQMTTSLSQADALVNQPQSNLKKQFAQYRESLDDLEETTGDVRNMVNDMRARKDAYFAQWEKDVAKIENEDIKQVSQQRRSERIAQFEKLHASALQVRDTFAPFMSDLQSIEQALSVELNAGSLDAMKPFVAKAHTNAVPLQKAMDDLRTQFKALGVEMSPKVK